jgi:hypothetical protein
MRLLPIIRFGLAGMLAMGLRADEERKLPVPHAKAKLICHDCHQKEKPTSAAIPDEACMVCHGDYPAMKAVTKNAKPNPHDQHNTPPFACTDCHRQHKPPVVKCLECHEGKYTFKMK